MKHFEIVHEQLLFSENKTQINQSIHFDGLKRTFFQSAYGSLSTRSAGRNSFNLNINQFRFFLLNFHRTIRVYCMFSNCPALSPNLTRYIQAAS